jgi:predicted TIM-barrel enzyme
VEDQKSLKTGALISEFSGSVEDQIDQFLADGVVTSGVVVGGIFFSGDKLFWVEKLSVSTGSDFINNSWFQIDENGPWNVLAGSGFREKGVERIITASDCFVGWHLSIWLDSVFEAVKFPTGITDLNTGLTNVD